MNIKKKDIFISNLVKSFNLKEENYKNDCKILLYKYNKLKNIKHLLNNNKNNHIKSNSNENNISVNKSFNSKKSKSLNVKDELIKTESLLTSLCSPEPNRHNNSLNKSSSNSQSNSQANSNNSSIHIIYNKDGTMQKFKIFIC